MNEDHGEALALICDEMHEAARGGASYAEVEATARSVLTEQDVLEGVPPDREAPMVELDRRAAIRSALRGAGAGDVVVIAGKGHETGQTFDGVTTPFDDRVVAAEELEACW